MPTKRIGLFVSIFSKAVVNLVWLDKSAPRQIAAYWKEMPPKNVLTARYCEYLDSSSSALKSLAMPLSLQEM